VDELVPQKLVNIALFADESKFPPSLKTADSSVVSNAKAVWLRLKLEVRHWILVSRIVDVRV
jgi:hypothetical protein